MTHTIDFADIDTRPIRKRTLIRRGYGERAADYILDRPYLGTLENADAVHTLIGDCGDTITVALRLEGERIAEIRFGIDGCSGTVAAAMGLADLSIHRSMAEAESITEGDVFRWLGEVPEEKEHCIGLVLQAFHRAIRTRPKG